MKVYDKPKPVERSTRKVMEDRQIGSPRLSLTSDWKEVQRHKSQVVGRPVYDVYG